MPTTPTRTTRTARTVTLKKIRIGNRYDGSYGTVESNMHSMVCRGSATNATNTADDTNALKEHVETLSRSKQLLQKTMLEQLSHVQEQLQGLSVCASAHACDGVCMCGSKRARRHT